MESPRRSPGCVCPVVSHDVNAQDFDCGSMDGQRIDFGINVSAGVDPDLKLSDTNRSQVSYKGMEKQVKVGALMDANRSG